MRAASVQFQMLDVQLEVFNYNSLLKSILEMYFYKEMSDQSYWLVKINIGNQRLIYVISCKQPRDKFSLKADNMMNY
jgi:hypothetical protein